MKPKVAVLRLVPSARLLDNRNCVDVFYFYFVCIKKLFGLVQSHEISLRGRYFLVTGVECFFSPGWLKVKFRTQKQTPDNKNKAQCTLLEAELSEAFSLLQDPTIQNAIDFGLSYIMYCQVLKKGKKLGF